MPAWNMARRTFSSDDDGPSVATILVRLRARLVSALMRDESDMNMLMSVLMIR